MAESSRQPRSSPNTVLLLFSGRKSIDSCSTCEIRSCSPFEPILLQSASGQAAPFLPRNKGIDAGNPAIIAILCAYPARLPSRTILAPFRCDLESDHHIALEHRTLHCLRQLLSEEPERLALPRGA